MTANAAALRLGSQNARSERHAPTNPATAASSYSVWLAAFRADQDADLGRRASRLTRAVLPRRHLRIRSVSVFSVLAPNQFFRASGASTSGGREPPDCSQALSATRCQCSCRFRCARFVEAHNAVVGQHGRDAFDAEFGRFLHDEVHALAARYALHEVDFERRFGAHSTLSPIEVWRVLRASPSIVAGHSGPVPSKTVIVSPMRSRSTRPR